MTPDQLLRRWATRARRAIVGVGANHDPVVEVEGARPVPAAPPPRPRGSRLGRSLRFLSGFVVTLSLLAIGFAALSARLAQVRPDWSVVAAPTAGGPYAFAAADAAVSLVTAEDAYRDGFFLAPKRRQARLAAFQAGSASAVSAFVTVLDERRRRSDPDLAAAAAELGALSFEDPQADYDALAAGRESLVRFADRVSDGRARYAPDTAVLAALARACQTASLAHTAELAAQVQRGRFGPISADAEASFYRARGEAYAWRLLLSAYGRDMSGPARASVEPALSDVVAASEDAADYQPLFLLNGAQQSAIVPNHLAHLALKLTQLSTAAETLARDARTPPPA